MELILQKPKKYHWLIQVNGLTKIISAILLIAGILCLPVRSSLQLVWLILWTSLLILLALRINSKLIKYFRRSAMMFLLLTIALPFNPASTQDLVWLRINGLDIYRSGVHQFVTTFLKAMQILTVSLIIVSTTPYTVLLKSLQKLKIPDWVLAILMYMFRLIFLMEQEMVRMKRAMHARSAKISIKRKLQILINFTGVYLARLTERSERSYLAMVSRGFHGKIEFGDDVELGFKDVAFLAITVTYFLGIAL